MFSITLPKTFYEQKNKLHFDINNKILYNFDINNTQFAQYVAIIVLRSWSRLGKDKINGPRLRGQAKPWLHSNCKGGIRNCKNHSKNKTQVKFVLKTTTTIEMATFLKNQN